MKQVVTIGRATYKQALRQRAFLGISVITLLIFLFSGVLSRLSVGDIFKVTQDICLLGLTFMGLFISIFLSTQMLSADLEQKTVHLVLAKPIPRWYYIFGRYVGLCTFTAVATTVAFIVFLVFLYYFQRNLPIYHAGDIHLFQYFLFFLAFELKLFLIIALGLFFSSFSSSGLVSFFFTSVVYLVASNLQNVKFILESNIGRHISSLTKTIFNISYWVVPNVSLLDFKDAAVHGISIGASSYALSMAYGLLYSAGLVLVTCFIFDRREFS